MKVDERIISEITRYNQINQYIVKEQEDVTTDPLATTPPVDDTAADENNLYLDPLLDADDMVD